MRFSVASLRGRNSSSILLSGLPVVAAFLMLAPTVTVAQEAAAAPAGGTVASYTDEQAKRGKKAYTDNCSVCHGTPLVVSGEAPAVVGQGFRERFFVGSPEPIFSYVSSNMPADNPGGLTPETYADIVAYLMSKNHVPAGDAELPSDAEALKAITLPPLN